MQQRRIVVCARAIGLGALLVCIGSAAPAHAQDFGVRGGASVDPDQFYVGAHVEAGPIVDRLYFKPNVEVGFGDDLTLAAINLEFVYRVPLPRSEWAFYGGGGPAINIFSFDNGRRDDNTETEAGFNFVFGVQHFRGFFTEFKAGVGDSPDLKFGVGYTWR
jgi:hypothetical protein